MLVCFLQKFIFVVNFKLSANVGYNVKPACVCILRFVWQVVCRILLQDVLYVLDWC